MTKDLWFSLSKSQKQTQILTQTQTQIQIYDFPIQNHKHKHKHKQLTWLRWNKPRKKKEKKRIENEVVWWRHMEEVKRLEAQVMAGGEGFQANQAGGDRCSGRWWQIGGWGWVRGSDRESGRGERDIRLSESEWNENIVLGFFFLTYIYIGGILVFLSYI